MKSSLLLNFSLEYLTFSVLVPNNMLLNIQMWTQQELIIRLYIHYLEFLLVFICYIALTGIYV